MVRRVAMLSVHTSPLAQAGTGDAGGLNVYVVQTALRLAQRGIEVEIFTRATSSVTPEVVELAPGILVRHITAGPFEGLAKEDLPGQLCAFAAGLMRTEAGQPVGHYDLVHSHYWLSGQVGWLVADRWQVPLVHTMHTMAKVKNLALAQGDQPEPAGREIGEAQVVAEADWLVANTVTEANQLTSLYEADPERVQVVHPGVDLALFQPGDRLAARQKLGLRAEGLVVLFVGRIQPLKAPDVLLRAVAELLRRRPELRSRLQVPIVGGPSGTGLLEPASLKELGAELGILDVLQFEPPATAEKLVQWYQSADLIAVPSYSESFGLVALEAQACGTPVLAAKVSGLQDAVVDRRSGLLIDGHDPVQWARALASAIDQPALREQWRAGAIRHAAEYSWDKTVDGLIGVYGRSRLRQFHRSPLSSQPQARALA